MKRIAGFVYSLMVSFVLIAAGLARVPFIKDSAAMLKSTDYGTQVTGAIALCVILLPVTILVTALWYRIWRI